MVPRTWELVMHSHFERTRKYVSARVYICTVPNLDAALGDRDRFLIAASVRGSSIFLAATPESGLVVLVYTDEWIPPRPQHRAREEVTCATFDSNAAAKDAHSARQAHIKKVRTFSSQSIAKESDRTTASTKKRRNSVFQTFELTPLDPAH